MDDYKAILVYAAFAFVVFGLAMIWRRYRYFLQKMFHFRYGPQSGSEDNKPVHHN
jgi:hypothetical protein